MLKKIIAILVICSSTAQAEGLTPRQQERLLNCYEDNLQEYGRFTKQRCHNKEFIGREDYEKKPQHRYLRRGTDSPNGQGMARQPYRSWDE